MKILQCHNFYQQPGGEDQVFHDEARLLRSHGHEVIQFTRHNDAIRQMPSWQLAVRTVWNRQTSAENCGARSAASGPSRALHEYLPAAFALRLLRGQKGGREGRPIAPQLPAVCVPTPCFCETAAPAKPVSARRSRGRPCGTACYRNDRRSTAVVAGNAGRFIAPWGLGAGPSICSWRSRNSAGASSFRAGFPPRRLPSNRTSHRPIPDRPREQADMPFLSAGSRGKGDRHPAGRVDALGRLAGAVDHCGRRSPRGARPSSGRVKSTNSMARPAAVRARHRDHRSGDVAWSFRRSWYEGFPKIDRRGILQRNARRRLKFRRHGRVDRRRANGPSVRSRRLGEPDRESVQASVRNTGRPGQMRSAARKEFEQKFTSEANYQILMAAYVRALGDRSDCQGGHS